MRPARPGTPCPLWRPERDGRHGCPHVSSRCRRSRLWRRSHERSTAARWRRYEIAASVSSRRSTNSEFRAALSSARSRASCCRHWAASQAAICSCVQRGSLLQWRQTVAPGRTSSLHQGQTALGRTSSASYLDAYLTPRARSREPAQSSQPTPKLQLPFLICLLWLVYYGKRKPIGHRLSPQILCDTTIPRMLVLSVYFLYTRRSSSRVGRLCTTANWNAIRESRSTTEIAAASNRRSRRAAPWLATGGRRVEAPHHRPRRRSPGS